MMFRVGQKVVGIGYNCGGDRDKLPPGANMPAVGSVYTIRSINEWSDVTLITLQEVDNRHLIGFDGYSLEPGYNIRAFRPIVERKTDISALKALLVPGAKILEDV